jgi:hypothetical protein
MVMIDSMLNGMPDTASYSARLGIGFLIEAGSAMFTVDGCRQ